MIKLTEAIHVQKPEPEMKKNQEIPGYLSRTETEPETGTSTTYLESEPELLKIARVLDKSIKELKYYAALPEERHKAIRIQAQSILTSLRNAVGKLRDLDRVIKGLERMDKK